MTHDARGEMLGHLADAVGSVKVAHPTRVAVDGPPAAGKTTLADELSVILRAQGRHVIRASIDDFLFPRAQRYPRGEYSAEGCYLDAHDYEALNRVLLDPLGPGGDREFQHAVYDRASDAVVSLPVSTAPACAVLVFDGVFLLRPELVDRWDLRIFVSTADERTIDRARARDGLASAPEEIERRWRDRYIPSQQLYVTRVHPTDQADLIVYNDEPQQPRWETRARMDRTQFGS
jgi:uridine kinase